MRTVNRRAWKIFFRRRVGVLVAAAAFVLLLNAACGWWTLDTRTAPVEPLRQAPAFSLPDAMGREVSLDSLLAEGPAVVVFYRGHW